MGFHRAPYYSLGFLEFIRIPYVSLRFPRVLYALHYGLLDSYLFQTTSISYSGFSWVSGSQGEPSELNSKGSGCDHEVLGVLELKNLKAGPNLTKYFSF